MNLKRIEILVFTVLFATSVHSCRDDNFVPYAESVPVEVDVAPLNGYIQPTRAGKGPMNGWFNTEVYMAYGESADGVFSGFTSAKKGMVVLGKTSFLPQLFYPDTKTIFLKGFHPREGITNIDDGLNIPPDGRIRYTITGREDIMISNMVSGSAANTLKYQYSQGETSAANATLTYNHLLTQMSFTMKCETGFPSSIRVKYIRIKNVKINAVLDLDPLKSYDNSLSFDETSKADIVAYENAAGFTLSTTSSVELGNIMFCPGEVFTIEVELSNGDKIAVPEIFKNNGMVNLSNGNTEMGLHYVVALTFKIAGLLPEVTAVWNSQPIGDTQEWW